jgi:type II protein arginine methyltransferase
LQVLRSSCWVVIEPKTLEGTTLTHYRDYLNFMQKFVSTNWHDSEQDKLREPLQPLRDDLDFGTYETFERDNAKYTLYQKAMEAAMIDKVPESEKEKKLVVVIVGAGRGPLVRAALNASLNTGRKIKIVIVEKNRNAINTLRALVRDLWNGKEIEIIAKDMRHIQLSEKADIMVSELLGSFGDNELSPECLDGAQHLLKDDGISIPCNSISYLRPIMSKRVNSNISKCITNKMMNLPFESRFQNPWLVYIQSVFYIDDAKEAIKFVHPNKDVPIDNSKNITMEFNASIDCVLHGFSGYFSSKLYKEIEISIHPETHTKGMASWYSIYFPLSETVNVKKGDRIELSFWRKVDDTKVWYEYQLLSPKQTKVINKDGIIAPILL